MNHHLYLILFTVPEKCSAPYVPSHATIQGLQLNYDYGDSITVTCDNSSARFTLQCDTKGIWSGLEVSCPVPTPGKTFFSFNLFDLNMI